jgi:hypothetical protein
MNFWTRLAVGLALLFSTSQGLAQEKYTIKLKELGAGESSRVEIKEERNVKYSATLEKETNTVDSKMTKSSVFEDTIIEHPGATAMPTKIKRVYERAAVESTGVFSQELVPNLSGKTVLIEKKGEKYEFTIDGRVPQAADNLELNEEFNNKGQETMKTLLPPGPVGVKENWKIDALAFFGDIAKGPTTKVFYSAGTATLAKVYKKDNRLYGVIDAVLDIQLKMTLSGAKAGEPDVADMRVKTKLTAVNCIDGTLTDMTLKGNVTINMTATSQQGALAVAEIATTSIQETRRELPNK